MTTLDKIKSIQSADHSQNLHSHLKKLIYTIAQNRDSIDSFQAESTSHKGKPKPQVVFKIRQAYAHIQQFQKKNRQLVGKINIGTQQEPQQPASLGYVPDFMQESRVFSKFGIGFSQNQTYLIFKSLCRFAQKKNAKQVRLWGKILGRQKDYYIAQGVADSTQQAGQLAADIQAKGTGCNKIQYWATTELSGEWTELPLVSPQQLITSRKIKYMFTGNLNNSILSNPAFPGKQSHLLKCQLVRINTTCSIVPKGMYVVNAEDSKQIDSPQEFIYPDILTLSEKQNWTYFHPSILKNGRISLLKPEGLQPQEQQKIMKQMASRDPVEPRLKKIVMDNQNWTLKSFGLEQIYKTVGKQSKSESKGVLGIKNLVWPGWMTVAYGAKYQSIYVGYGHKGKQTYYPSEPEEVLAQNQDKNQFVVNE